MAKIICPRCSGKGTHYDTSTELDLSRPGLIYDFLDDFAAGTYDVACEVCQGQGHVTPERYSDWVMFREISQSVDVDRFTA